GVKITPRAFGKDRRLPITNCWHVLHWQDASEAGPAGETRPFFGAVSALSRSRIATSEAAPGCSRPEGSRNVRVQGGKERGARRIVRYSAATSDAANAATERLSSPSPTDRRRG